MKNYQIHRRGEERQLGEVTVTVHDVGKQFWLNPKTSQEVRNHSPTGFEFGYAGSGPAQLALAILLDYMGKPPEPACYQAFKFMFIMPMKHPGGMITGDDIEKFLETWKAEQEGVYQGQ